MYRFFSKPGPNRVTVAGDFQNGVLRLAVSRSSKKDAFTRKKGAMIAEGRLRKGKTIAEIPMDTCNGQVFVQVASEIIDQVLENPELVHGHNADETVNNPEMATDGIGN